MSLVGKKILLGITGSIAAYKAATLTRLFVKAGAEVQVLMTPSAAAFISPLTLSTLSKRPVYTDVISGSSWNNHVELGLWADVYIVAPCTASTLSKLRMGLCNNMVVAAYLSARCPVFVNPAMDLDMWTHPSTRENVEKLTSYGNHIIQPGTGELASGLVGQGRMAEPEDIVSEISAFLTEEVDEAFQGKKVVITAGPTYEPIDPVRFIGNRSSGKMGIALADELASRGCNVKLVLGPSAHLPKQASVQVVAVKTAQEMYDVVMEDAHGMDIAIMAAAVADYTPVEVASQKVKKKTDRFSVELKKTLDIAKAFGEQKKAHQSLVGFALETNDAIKHAQGKLAKKNLDFIVLNSLQDKGAGFGHDTNKITIIDSNKTETSFTLKSKTEVAKDIVDHLRTKLLPA